MAGAQDDSLPDSVDEAPDGLPLVELSTAINMAFADLEDSASVEEAHPASCVTTGLVSFDRLVGGLKRKDLVLLTGEPGVGKTTLVLQWAREAALRHASESVVFCTLETPSEHLAKRLLTMHCGVPMASWEKVMAAEDYYRLVTTGVELSKLHLYFDETLDLTIAHLGSVLAGLVTERPFALLVIDAIDLMPEVLEGVPARQAAVCLKLRQLARLVDCPAVAVLNTTSRADSSHAQGVLPPELANRTDVTLLLERSNPRSRGSRGQRTLTVLRNVHGATGSFALRIDPKRLRFGEPDQEKKDEVRRATKRTSARAKEVSARQAALRPWAPEGPASEST